MSKKNILIVDDDASLLRVMEHHLSGAGYTVQTARNGRQGLEAHQASPAAVIFTDLKMPEMDGLSFIQEIRKTDPVVSIIAITGFATVESAVAAMKAGTLDFIQKPVEKEQLLAVTARACTFFELQHENSRLRSLVAEHLDFGHMVGQSAAIRDVYRLAQSVADSNVTVLINGETGTGKEMLAKALHSHGRRRNSRFVAINCAAVPAQLLESELFGHVKGAFTGALTDRCGLIAEAEGGTLFLDEIGDLPLELQPKLLRVLQEREFQPVGSNRSIKTDARFVVATHRDLRQMVAEKLFREDLFYRLNVVPVTIPPVRQRPEDIVPLFQHFLKAAAREEHKPLPRLEKEVLDRLEQYPWPGNVREIQNLAQRLMAVHSAELISLADLPSSLRPSREPSVLDFELPEEGLDLERWTDNIVLAALKRNQWNQSRTASYLKISRNTLIYRMKQNKLTPPAEA